MEIKQVLFNDENWKKLIEFVKSSSWSESPIIAKNWEKYNYLEWERIFAAFENDNIIGHCSFNSVDCVPDVDYTPYIQSVFVNEKYCGKRVSEKLINTAIEYAKSLGFKEVYIVSGHINFYEKYGFIKMDEKKEYRGVLQGIYRKEI